MKHTALCLGAFLLLALLPPGAESQDSGASASSRRQPDVGPASGPATTEEKARTPAETSPASAEKAIAPAESKKPKKVWTNDEIGSVKGGISVVGDNDPSAGEQAARMPLAKANGNRERLIENYRNQIEQLNAQIDAIDKRITQLKNFKGENSTPSGGISLFQGYDMVPLEEQVKKLEEQKRQAKTRIEDVEIDARKNGIEPGDLR